MPRSLALFVLFAAPGLLTAQAPVDYARDVRPLLKRRCYACHGALKQKGRLRLDSVALMRRGGRGGPAIVPGDPARSTLLERVAAADESERMPPEGERLTAQEIARLRAWIAAGAKVTADDSPESDPRQHWAFQKPTRPPVPVVKDAAWVRQPIDAFLAAEYEKRGLTPSPPAERHVLLRRVTLDLIGLPPTRAELHAFLADEAPDAYERVVDRLLARPEYAERWARHWMDVWRYSDWYGRRSVPDVLNSYPMIWRWRDWIVRALAEDRGYDRMIQQMLAADEIAPTDDAQLAATGFIVRNFFRWNYEQWKKDLVEHTGKAFLGLTLNCCHCHDHKYDPITQEEYFRFRAFFEPVDLRHERVPGEPDPGPYPDYDYGKSFGPIRSGMVRVYDRKLDAPTFMYTGGDPRNKIAGRPPVTPGAPAILGGDTLRIVPVALPRTAWYPGLKAFVQHDETVRRQQAVALARTALAALQHKPTSDEPGRLARTLAEARQAAALADLDALKARIAADDARHGGSGNAAALARAASKSERRAALAAARTAYAQKQHALALAQREPKKKGRVAPLKKQLAAAAQAITAAEKALTAESATYTPLGPTFPSTSSGRRKALAEWITQRDNPLTARVAVNYIWGWHFGQPLVPTVFDFGRNGKPPTHPQLLDWLAVEFMTSGWSHKHLHRLLVTSNAYRMRSDLGGRTEHPNLARDPDNRFLWRFRTARMEAEVLRDSLLYLSGELDPTRGGPEIPHEQGLVSRRRSLYFAHHGEGRMQFLELFDAANACECYQRTLSVVPQQALALSNSELSLRVSRSLARRLWDEAGLTRGSDERFITTAFEQVLGRGPDADERAACVAFLARQVKLLRASGINDSPAQRARASLVQALFNHNEFITVR